MTGVLDEGEREPPGGSAEARAVANKNKKLDDGERASPDGSESAETGAAATGVLDDRGPPCGSAGAGAAATGPKSV